MKTITIRVREEQFERLQGLAEERVLPVSNFVAQVIFDFLDRMGGKGQSRPLLSEEEKKKRREANNFEKDVDFFFGQDQGSICPGSNQSFPYNGEFGKYPGAICTFCSRQMWGKREEGLVVLRKHKDGRQTDRDLEQVDTSVISALTKKEERDQRRRLKG
jgi:hypothetical protein